MSWEMHYQCFSRIGLWKMGGAWEHPSQETLLPECEQTLGELTSETHSFSQALLPSLLLLANLTCIWDVSFPDHDLLHLPVLAAKGIAQFWGSIKIKIPQLKKNNPETLLWAWTTELAWMCQDTSKHPQLYLLICSFSATYQEWRVIRQLSTLWGRVYFSLTDTWEWSQASSKGGHPLILSGARTQIGFT